MNTLIHFLEGTTLVLVGLLIAQVSRCYLNFTRMEQAQENLAKNNHSHTMSVRVNISRANHSSPSIDTAGSVSAADDTPLEQLKTPKKTDAIAPLSEKVAVESTENNQNDQILNDYIGEFFAETVQPDIQAFKNSSTEVNSSHISHEPRVEALESASDSDEIIMVESQSKITPVIIDETEFEEDDQLPVLTEIATLSADDDSIITVASDHEGNQSDEKVMSDKVVHAMLDEARLVCAS